MQNTRRLTWTVVHLDVVFFLQLTKQEEVTLDSFTVGWACFFDLFQRTTRVSRVQYSQCDTVDP